jgi:hypothetical protein
VCEANMNRQDHMSRYVGNGMITRIDNENREASNSFNCNETRHIHHDCPHKKQKINIHAFMEQLEDDEFTELKEECQDERELGFMDSQ